MKELFYQLSPQFQFIMIKIINYFEFDIFANIIKNNKDIIILYLDQIKNEKLVCWTNKGDNFRFEINLDGIVY